MALNGEGVTIKDRDWPVAMNFISDSQTGFMYKMIMSKIGPVSS